jgi:ornithine decarboxylase
MERVTVDDARKILVDRPINQKSLYISSPKFIENLIGKFHTLLPRVIPHYAVKCNDDNVLLKTLLANGVNFDCASAG